LATTFALENEVTAQDDSASKSHVELEVKQQEPIMMLYTYGYACNPDMGDYFPGERANSVGFSSNQLVPEDLTPYWLDYP